MKYNLCSVVRRNSEHRNAQSEHSYKKASKVRKNMLKIKLARFGKRNQPHYRIVVNEARSKRDGQYIDLIGHYAPTQTPKVLKMNMELYKEWLTKGAQPTDTVARLATRYESGNPFPAKKPTLSKKAKAKAAQAAEEKAQAAEEKAQAAKEASEAKAQKAEAPAKEAKEKATEAPTEEATEEKTEA
jgi:small subunit ribosomal protein S16